MVEGLAAGMRDVTDHGGQVLKVHVFVCTHCRHLLIAVHFLVKGNKQPPKSSTGGGIRVLLLLYLYTFRNILYSFYTDIMKP